ncbi:MAG TPA: hypothetical protein VJ276_24610 [Thermoanaerobaculia bacterium]|nr:hypothetical protein [Thermoanaerobaculia bacterium]
MTALRDAYLLWRDAARRRSARGELRASAEEVTALERFVAALEACTAGEREAWEAERAGLDKDDELCACGHPRAHHDAEGSCFHVVGCATACGCHGTCLPSAAR